VSRPTLYGLMELHGIEVEPTRGFDPATPDTAVGPKLDME
jgi:hypothetical protein